MIQQCKSYKTSDGTLHNSRYDALLHEYNLEVRGLIQAAEKNVAGHYTIGQVASILTRNSALISKRMSYYNNQLGKAKSRQSKVENNLV